MKTTEPEILQGADAAAVEEGMLFEPFFRSRQESVRIQRTQSLAERRKFAVAFRMFGCVRCGTNKRPHAACGFCAPCYQWYRGALNKALRAIARGEAE